MKTIEALSRIFAKRKTAKDGDFASNMKPIYCVDGTSLSVQASRKHSCVPKNNEGPYTAVEVGFPSVKPPESWRTFTKQDFDVKACDTVYHFLPLELVGQFIDAHGGIRPEVVPVMIVPPAPAPPVLNRLEQRKYDLTVEDLGFRV
jgi:hypothetical protein